jgi:hypothetical protein
MKQIKLNKIKANLERRKGERSTIRKLMLEAKTKIKTLTQDLYEWEQAQALIQQAAQQTLDEITVRLEAPVSLALSTVWPDNPYTFKLNIEIKNGQAKATPLFIRGENKVKLGDSTGDGAVDIASIALRLAVWAIKFPRTRPVIILEEPFPHLSPDKHQAAGKVLQQIAKELNIQLIMITFSKNLQDIADKKYKVTQNTKGESVVNIIEED